MSSENLEVITEEEKKVPVININRNVGETNEGEIMPQKVSLEEKVIPAENENPELNVEKDLEDLGAENIESKEIDNSATESLATSKDNNTDAPIVVDQNDIIESPDDAMIDKKTEVILTPEMQKVIELYSTFEKSIGSYVTMDQAKEVVKNNYNDETIAKVIKEIETYKAREEKSQKEEGRDSKLVFEGVKELRKALVEENRGDLAQNLNINNIKETYKQLKDGDNKVSSKLVYKLAGINPELDGVDDNTRFIMSFAHYDDEDYCNSGSRCYCC